MAKTKYLTKALRCPDGSRKYIRGKTQKELDEKVRQAQMELGMGINIADTTTFSELAQTWLDLCKRPKVRASTVQLILTNMNKHVIPYIGHLRVRDIRPAHIANVMSHASGLAKGTQSNILIRMKEVFQFGIDNRIIALSPVTTQFKPSGSGPAERIPLTDEQVEALEFIIKSETRYTGIPLKDLSLKSNNLIACIARKRQIIIPGGDDCMHAGDSVIVVTMEKKIEDLEDILM